MIRDRIKLFVAALFIIIILVPAQALPAEKDVLRAVLANGLRVVIVKNTLAPVVTTEVNYLAGSNEAPEGFPGMAHAQEHMMFRGSPGLSADQLSNIIALMGGDFNADTQQTVTQYFFTVPKEDLDVALNLEAVRMRGVLDSEDLWKEERGAIEQEVAQDLSSPDYLFSMQLLAAMFPGTPYAHDALGTRESFQKTTGAMLKSFYDSWYAPNNAILIIIGDVDPKAVLGRVRELFESIPKRPLPPRPAIALKPPVPAVIEIETDQPNGLAVAAFRLPGFESPDFAAGMILADVLESRRGDLYALVPAGKALFTGFDGEVLPKAGFGYALAGFPRGADGKALVAEIKAVIAGYLKNGLPADLVEAAKRHEITDAEFQRNSVSGLAAAWSQALAVEGRTSPDDDIDAIKKVTAADVNRVAREYLKLETAVTAVLTPQPTGKAVSGKGFGGKESFAPAQTVHVDLPGWARNAEALPPVPVSRVTPSVFTLPNGIRLIVQTENISPTVSVAGQVKNNSDLEEPAGKEGVSDLLTGLFSYGTTSLDRLAFQKAQDDLGAEITAGTDFSLRVLSDGFERGMELLADNLFHPALPESAFSVLKLQTVGSLRGEIQSPAYLTRQTLRESLYPKNDPELRDPTPESVATLTLEDVKAYYARAFRPDMTTIVVAGQVTPERARRVVEKYFGSWKATGPKPVTDPPAVPPNKPSASVVPDASRVQDEVTLAETLGITRSDPDYYKLQLGNHVLTGAFYASRLYRDLREKNGLVYTVESFIDAEKTRSLFGVFYACDPPNVSRARALVENNLRMMQTAPVSANELKLAKMLLLHRIPLSESSVDEVSRGLLARSLEDLPLDEPVRAARTYRETTAEQVREAFAKWVRPADFVQVTTGPQPE